MAITQATATTEEQQTPLPRPDTFDILPALHELLSRIDHQSPAPANEHAQSGLTALTSEEEDSAYAELAPLEPRDLPSEALPIKAKIRKALRELEKLPDMDRSVAEQEEEIERLESRLRRQREVLRNLGEAAQAMAK